jgi:hypothetical protein
VAWDENTLKVSKNLRGALIKYNAGTDLYDVTPYDASGMGASSPFMSRRGTRDQGTGVVWGDVIEGVGVGELVDFVQAALAGHKRGRNPTSYELFYNDGGHGGPWIGLDDAIRQAKRIIAGSPSTTAITIHPHSATGMGGYGPAIIRVDADKVQALTPQADRLLHGAGVMGRDDAYRVNPGGGGFSDSEPRFVVGPDDWPLGNKQWWAVYDAATGAKVNLRGYGERPVYGSERLAQIAANKANREGVREDNPDSDLPKCYELGRRLGAAGGVGHKMQQGPRLEQFARRRIKQEGLRPPLMSDGIRTFLHGFDAGLRQSNPAPAGGWMGHRALTGEDPLDVAFEAGKEWGEFGAANSGVANSRVRHYGFVKWYNNQAPGHLVREGPPRRKLTKAQVEKAFNEGYKIGKERYGYFNEQGQWLSRTTGRKHNPASGAAAKYEEFHGVPSEQETVITEEVHYHGNLAGLGDLVEIVIKTPSGYKAVLDFDKSGTLLCSSEDGKQLYLRGGDQSIDLDAIHMSSDEWLRDSMVLGLILKMTYRTAKKFDGLKVLDYEHKLGEESGVRPELIYDVLNNQLSVAGGQYDVRPEGVVN